jgi:hypothetical protein
MDTGSCTKMTRHNSRAIREEGLNVRAMMCVCVSQPRSAGKSVGRLSLEAGAGVLTLGAKSPSTSNREPELCVSAGTEAGTRLHLVLREKRRVTALLQLRAAGCDDMAGTSGVDVLYLHTRPRRPLEGGCW